MMTIIIRGLRVLHARKEVTAPEVLLPRQCAQEVSKTPTEAQLRHA